MKRVALSFVVVAGLIATGACSKKQVETAQTPPVEVTPEAASPNDSPAMVTLTDGSSYHGALISKNGSQMTFRGDNGATRTLDSRDIQSIRFSDVETASTNHKSSPPSEGSYTPTAPPPSPNRTFELARNRAMLPSGTQISVRNNAAIDSKTASAGQIFSAVIASNVVDDSGAVAIPRGSAATLIVRQAGAGRIHANDLALALHSVAVAGVPRQVQTGILFKKGRDGVGANKRTAVFSGGGAAVGALIGGLVGGGKGAGIGAASGAGAGAGTQILTRGSVKVPSESLMSFTLQAPLAL
ncbi:MAG: hypothetical protein ACR2JB_31120 [Bryobacteraceae bacterium]